MGFLLSHCSRQNDGSILEYVPLPPQTRGKWTAVAGTVSSKCSLPPSLSELLFVLLTSVHISLMQTSRISFPASDSPVSDSKNCLLFYNCCNPKFMFVYVIIFTNLSPLVEKPHASEDNLQLITVSPIPSILFCT